MRLLSLVVVLLLLVGFAARPAVANALFACDAPIYASVVTVGTPAAEADGTAPATLFGQGYHIIGVLPVTTALPEYGQALPRAATPVPANAGHRPGSSHRPPGIAALASR